MRALGFSSQFGHSGVLNLLLAEGGIEHFGPAGLALGLVPPAVRSLSNAVGNRSARAAMSAADRRQGLISAVVPRVGPVWPVGRSTRCQPCDGIGAKALLRRVTASGANAGLGQ